MKKDTGDEQEIRKKSLRGISLEKRKNYSKEYVDFASDSICHKVVELVERWDLLKKENAESFVLCFYAATGNEVSLWPAFEYAVKKQIPVYFPKVHGEDMEFYLVNHRSQLQEGAFHILEPILTQETQESIKLSCESKKLILVPGVAFSTSGQRIGYGKGFYDRYLSKARNYIAVGITYDELLLEPWLGDSWDIIMNEIITEKRKVTIQ